MLGHRLLTSSRSRCRQGLKIAGLEEIAFRKGWIWVDDVLRMVAAYGGGEYGRYLKRLVHDHPVGSSPG